MYLKSIIRTKSGTFEVYTYYRLCGSYRDETGRNKWRNVLSGARHWQVQRKKQNLVRASSIRHRDVREIGPEHLCYKTVQRFGGENFFLSNGFDEEKASLALIQIVACMVHSGYRIGHCHRGTETLGCLQPERLSD